MKPILRAPSTALLPAALLTVLATAACGSVASPGSGSSDGTTVVGSTLPAPTDGTGAGASGRATGSAGGVRLVASAAPGAPAHASGVKAEPGVVVEYTLTNTGSRPLAAYDIVPDSLGSAVLPADVDREHAWVYAHEGTVRVSKQGFATAPNVRFAAAPTMGARALPAGGTLTGRAFVPTPLALAVPGAAFTAPQDPLPPAAGAFSFCVQVGPAGPQLRPSPMVRGVLQAPVAAPSGAALVCTDPLTVPVS
jgi:hypothetical protein